MVVIMLTIGPLLLMSLPLSILTLSSSLSNPFNIPPTQYWLKKESRVSITQDKERLIRFGGGNDSYNHEMTIGSNLRCYINFQIDYEDTTGRERETFTGHAYNNVDELLVFATCFFLFILVLLLFII